MENPIEEIDAVIYKLTTGSPRLQQQTIEHYFTPNASFLHPFCAVNGSRSQILSIFRWYKILSPRIDIQVNGISYEAARQKLHIDISQTFRIWPLIPLGYRADVNLVTVLQLTRDPSGRDLSAERAIVENGATPSYGSNALVATEITPFTKDGKERPAAALPSTAEPVKYYIKSQNDLYQVPEFAKFVSLLGLLPTLINLVHMLATWCCVLGALVLTPFSNSMQKYSDKQVEHRARVRRDPAYGPSFGGDMSADERGREERRDVWEAEARFLGLGGEGHEGKMEGLKMKMGLKTKIEGKGKGKGGKENGGPVLEFMEMEESGQVGR